MATTTARPARKRAAAKAAPAAVETELETEAQVAKADAAPTVDKIKFEFIIGDETKSYQTIIPPADSGCVGKLYVPKGVTRAVILLTGE